MKDPIHDKIEFSFGWLALKLLGKSLYSNPWSALSELVANGFDAQATKVFVYIEILNKADATIELLDNGHGMNEAGMHTYVKVGTNNRDPKQYRNGYLTMGRKGIGKLAALYLSSDYDILTKTPEGTSQWRMCYNEDPNSSEHPFLSLINEDIKVSVQEEWDSIKTGTLIQMRHVDLRGLGEKAYEALSVKMANMFALDAMENKSIWLCVRSTSDQKIFFQEIKKGIAFKNMAFIDYHFLNAETKVKEEILDNSNNIIKFHLSKLNGKQFYNHICQVKEFKEIENVQVSGVYDSIINEKQKISKEYNLTGWIGLHASIDNEQARINDDRFLKNSYYNPIQLRLYVRNKLAIENFLPLLGNTQAFVNYIEGEIHFDILDDDDLPDIATSSRQGLNENDPRVVLLKNIVEKIVNNLISSRNSLTKVIKENEKSREQMQHTTAKKIFARETQKELENTSLSKQEQLELAGRLTNKICGEVTPKSDYTIFISHSSADKIFTDFIYYLLKHKGIKKEEFFYTSAEDSATKYENISSLNTQTRENIINKNAYILYMTSNAYKKSEYCMFEGGAGWATRSVGEYLLFSTTHEEIPVFLSQKLEFCLEKNNQISLGRNEYLFFVSILNKMIEHINAGRQAKNEEEIEKFPECEIPDDVVLKEKNQTIEEYMDADILKYWKTYVASQLDNYLAKRYPKNEEKSAI